MKRWSQWEVTYLFDHAGDGLEAVAAALGRTEASVRNTASRYGVSLMQSHVCPKCGCVTHSPLNPRRGWCRVCSLELNRDRAKRRDERARAELADEERRYADVWRERQGYYSSTHRVTRNYARCVKGERRTGTRRIARAKRSRKTEKPRVWGIFGAQLKSKPSQNKSRSEVYSL